MHIVFLADPIDNQNAGIHMYTKHLAKEFLKSKHKITFIHQQQNEFFNKTNHHIIAKKRRLGYNTYRKFYLIPKLITELNPDIVFEPCHIGPFRLPPHIKRVTTIHDMSPILFPETHTFRGSFIHKLLLKKTIRESDLIITPSENTKQDITNYRTHKNIKSIPLATSKPIVQKSQNFHPFLLYVGTIEPRKNLITLIDAFAELGLPNHKLIIAGTPGWKSSKILQKIHKTHNVILHTPLSEKEKSQLYASTDIFIYPSNYEGFGLPPMEAMSYGTPCIVAKNSSLQEIYSDTALMFSTKEELKNQIISLLTNRYLHQELSKKGAEFATKFSWEKTAKATLDEFKKLL